MTQPDWQATASLSAIRYRARLLQHMRAFFQARDVLEVETPLLSLACTSDIHLQSFETRYAGERRFLNTSPEFAMKRLLAQHGGSIFQICKAFRVDELGPNHNPEFTLLEWYRSGFTLDDLMNEMQQLIVSLAADTSVQFARISYREAFLRSAGFDPHYSSAAQCKQCAITHGIEIPVGLNDDLDEWLDWLLTQLVLPAMPPRCFTFFYDYPASQCALARVQADATGTPVAKRFELLYGELELANGFDELQDAAVQMQRFEADNARRVQQGAMPASIDQHLLAAMQHGLPRCAGVALGVDRLLMVLQGLDSISQVQCFPWAIA
jgi:lysyl-tRNA synthetase class 2